MTTRINMTPALLAGALLLAMPIATSRSAGVEPGMSDFDFQALVAEYTYCALQESERRATITTIRSPPSSRPR